MRGPGMGGMRAERTPHGRGARAGQADLPKKKPKDRSQVIKTLMDNPQPPAQNLLLTLTTNTVYNANILRRQLLIRALIPLQPGRGRADAG